MFWGGGWLGLEFDLFGGGGYTLCLYPLLSCKVAEKLYCFTPLLLGSPCFRIISYQEVFAGMSVTDRV